MSQAAAGHRTVRRAAGWRVVVPALALVLAACGGGDGEDAAALAARVAELEEELESSTTVTDPASDASTDSASEAADDTEAGGDAPAPDAQAPDTAAEVDGAGDAEDGAAAEAAPAPEADPEPAPEAAPEPEPEPDPATEESEESEPEDEEAEVETQEADAAEPITIEMESQRRTNSGAFVVVVRARSDTGGSAWGITDVLMERPNEYNALLDEDARWLGPQTGQRDQWTASLYCDRQSKYKDWLYVTATDEQGRTLRTRFEVTAAC